MCGRHQITTAPEGIRELFGVEGRVPNFGPRFNLAPTQDAPVVRIRGGERELAMLRWGLVPHWSSGPDSRHSMINARAEIVERTPAYRDAFRSRRCLVPADGFYEWQARDGGPKQPFRITLKDGATFAMAGLWERWEKGAEPIESFTIVVTDANQALKQIHERMPVILAPADYGSWLSGKGGKELLRHYAAEEITARAVSRRVNNPANDDPACIEEVTAGQV